MVADADVGTQHKVLSYTPTVSRQYRTAEMWYYQPAIGMARSTPPIRDFVKDFGVSTSSCVSKQIVRFTDVASLLPHREFKIHGGQLSDSGSETVFVDK